MRAHLLNSPRFLGSRLLSIVFVVFSMALSGCVSSGSSVSTYGGAAVTSAAAKRVSAKKDVSVAKRELKAAKKVFKRLERSIARDERKLKRKKLSAKSRTKIEKRLKKDTRQLRTAKRDLKRAERSIKRKMRAEKNAIRKFEKAKLRRADNVKRIAAAKKRETEKAKERAQASLVRDEPKDSPIRRGLFASADPALKNVKDYRARVDGSFALAAIPVEKLNKRLLRQQVKYRTSHKPGTVVVDTAARHLYVVERGGKAMRYGIGVGRQGFSWSGTAHIGWKTQWPKWTPPEEMIDRKPSLRKYSAENGGMEGGIKNPLGARALYLVKDGKDTLFRLHGTPQWASIGTAASSGCIRLINQDVIDLYSRVPNGAKVVVQ